jgi:uncharacterized delta-60 repeat protein
MTDVGEASDFGRAVQGDGKIVVAGAATEDTDVGGVNFALVRHKPNGALDNAFAGDGTTTTDFFDGNDAAVSVVLQPDGKVVAGGGTQDSGGNSNFALARYGQNGALDNTFSGDGRKQTRLLRGVDDAAGITLQPDGKIVAAGRAQPNATTIDFGLARYLGG